MNKRRTFSLFIPLICTAFSSLLVFTTLDAKVSDVFQRFLPSTKLRDDVIMVGIDDYAISTIGSFPFTRDVYADCIGIAEEMGADAVIYDLVFADNSKASVNSNFEPFYPDDVMQEALENSDITYLSLTFDEYTPISDYEKEVMIETAALKNFEAAADDAAREYTGVVMTLPDFLQNATGAGYVNADPDPDNFLRRVNIVSKFEGEYYTTLVLPAILNKLGNPKLIIENKKVILKDAHLPEGETKDIVIPRGNDGRLILKYPQCQFNDYNYLSMGDIYRIAQLRLYMEEDGEDEYIEEYEELCETLKNKLKGSLCIVGTCATSTSDYGVNQYEAQYPLPGVHYTVANQILNRDFVSETPLWVSILYALIPSFLIVFFTVRAKSTAGKIIPGFILMCASAAALLLFFYFTRIYAGACVPLASSFLTYILTILIEFFSASKDKKFITNAFSQCLSKDVVDQIVANPGSFKLGGESVQMTAIFTDIQKFSSFSELLTAGELVALLNYYLTKMSDIIMSQGGTIDKYEGDAIIALVGAPLKMQDHAVRAVRAAIKMKASEKLMNSEIEAIAANPMPPDMDEALYSAFCIMVKNGKKIFTRIGINSGEMIAGYMGSENKKNYTMMGNNVNLAARLEGVNKQYSTFGILISEATRELLGDEIVCRRLDKVQVVNVNTPLILYEPLAIREEASESLLSYASAWEEAMNLFDAEDYEEAHRRFTLFAEKNPSDKVAKYYVTLLEKFFLKGKAPREEDDFGVVYNSDLKCFRLLSK